MQHADFLIVGAGIAGASIAYQLRAEGSVVMLEMEDQPGYHTTGRSAAFYAETYGGPLIQPLTTASKPFFQHQPKGFADTPVLKGMGAIHTYAAHQQAEADALFWALKAVIPSVEKLSAAEVLARVPLLAASTIAGGIADPDCGTLDVATLHSGYLRAATNAGATLLAGAKFESAKRIDGLWHVQTSKGEVRARILINTAGAWGDEVAGKAGVAPLGLRPLRRTIITVPNPEGTLFNPDGPVVLNIEETSYFKPEGNGYLVSPADETYSSPCDAQPDLEDIALAAYNFEHYTGTTVKTIVSKWAGLRTFAPDRVPVIGYAPDEPSFFWSVGQGGYGIQTAPAWSTLAACLIKGAGMPDALTSAGVRAATYSPTRFRSVA